MGTHNPEASALARGARQAPGRNGAVANHISARRNGTIPSHSLIYSLKPALFQAGGHSLGGVVAGGRINNKLTDCLRIVRHLKSTHSSIVAL